MNEFAASYAKIKKTTKISSDLECNSQEKINQSLGKIAV